MSGYILLGTLAAYGALSVLWTLLGWLLPSGRGMVLVCMEMPDPGIFSRYRWLRGIGLLRCPLVAVSERQDGPMPQDLEICSRESLLQRLEWEKEQGNGTGTGDSAGRSQRRGVSEL